MLRPDRLPSLAEDDAQMIRRLRKGRTGARDQLAWPALVSSMVSGMALERLRGAAEHLLKRRIGGGELAAA